MASGSEAQPAAAAARSDDEEDEDYDRARDFSHRRSKIQEPASFVVFASDAASLAKAVYDGGDKFDALQHAFNSTQTLMQPYSQLRSLKNRPLSSILFLANAQTKTGVAIHGSGNPDVCVQRGQSQQAARVNDTFGVTRKIYGLTVFDTATSIKEKGEPGASDNTEAAGELGDSSMDVDSGYESFDDTGHSSPQGDFPSPGAAAMHGASSAEASHVSAPAPDFLDLPLHGRLVKDLAVFTTLNGFHYLVPHAQRASAAAFENGRKQLSMVVKHAATMPGSSMGDLKASGQVIMNEAYATSAKNPRTVIAGHPRP